jgi:hypothetical protein
VSGREVNWTGGWGQAVYLPVESPEFPRALQGSHLSDCEFGQVHFCAHVTVL